MHRREGTLGGSSKRMSSLSGEKAGVVVIAEALLCQGAINLRKGEKEMRIGENGSRCLT